MNKRIGLGMAVVIAVLAIAPSASASCNPDKSLGTYGAGLVYWHSTTSDPGTLVGQTWQVGNPGGWNQGSGALDCNNVDQGSGSPGFLYFAGGDKIGVNLHMGTCGTGCPAPLGGNTVAVSAQKSYAGGTDFLLATFAENPAGVLNYDFSTQGDHNLVSLPRPHVLSSSRAGTTVNLSVQVPAVSGGLYGPSAANSIIGYNILSAQASADPGRAASSYTQLATISAPGGVASASTPVGVNCSNTAQDQWIVTQLVFEAGSTPSRAVSQATRVNCNPALADPKNYKLIPKKQGAGSLNPQTPGSN